MSCDDVNTLDPYQFLALLGKRVLHPGGANSTGEICQKAGFTGDSRVLDIGCGVGASAIQIASRFGCQVMALDIDERMINFARSYVHAAGLSGSITFKQGDMQALPFEDNSFDVVIIEAVTMFTHDRAMAACEALRVCKPGGRVLDHELVWLEPGHEDVRRLFHNEICAGAVFDLKDDWTRLYQATGADSIDLVTAPFDMFTPQGLLRDEGLAGLLRVTGRSLSRWCYLRKMTCLMRRLLKVIPFLGTVLITVTKAGADKSSCRVPE
jgi:SAM-dependent methyltransferase